jgi:hypothetical protein
MIQIKERKEMEDSFKKAQKPWSKLLAKVNKTKVDYHTACKTEKSASNQERNASADSSLSPDQVYMLLYAKCVIFSWIIKWILHSMIFLVKRDLVSNIPSVKLYPYKK